MLITRFRRSHSNVRSAEGGHRQRRGAIDGVCECKQRVVEASRQSRYSGVFLHVMPWFNFVNHNQHGVDTAKYYRNAERELEQEKAGS